MTPEQIDQLVLSAYPDGFQTNVVTPLFPSAALGRCRHWMAETVEGTFCLRRWPKEQTSIERLQFIQAVLWHAVCEGIETVPLPLETRERKGIVRCDDSFWELLPWIDDAKENYGGFFPTAFSVDDAEENEGESSAVEPFQIASAMLSLAQFHEATASFPLPDPPQSCSSGIQERLARCRTWASGLLVTLRRTLEIMCNFPQNDVEFRLARIGGEFLDLVVPLSSANIVMLRRAAHLPISVQPTIRNASFRHLRFDEDGVCGMIDLTELGVDTVSLDVAMLLGSLVGEDSAAWDYGLKAYQSFRPLSDNERFLVVAFDDSQSLLEGLAYLEDVFLAEKPFTTLQLNEIRRRLERLVGRLRNNRRNRRSA